MSEKNIIIDTTVSAKFAEHLKNKGISPITVVKDLHISKGHLSLVLSGDRSLSASLRSKLNEYLNTNF